MKSTPPYDIELLKLPDGSRLIRVSDPATATALERRLDPAKAVAKQKNAVVDALRSLLARELKETAAIA
jgi:hypothetical protein